MISAQEACSKCRKPSNLCVCDVINPLVLKTHVLILQHPQEPSKELGTEPIISAALPNSTLRIGLSWRSLSHALSERTKEKSSRKIAENKPATNSKNAISINPKEWVVLFLGSAKEFAAVREGSSPLAFVDRKGKERQETGALRKTIKGIILLDGNWSQSKTLWWRNPWLLKCQRGVVRPDKASLYGNLRKEPRRESISTLEAAFYALLEIESKIASKGEGNREILEKNLLYPFEKLLERIRASASVAKAPQRHPAE